MEKKINRSFLFTWIIIMAAGTALLFIGITRESLWYDESYTAALMNHSIRDIINITGTDSHPPLYYLLLHGFTVVFGVSVFSLRAFSVVGAAGLAAWGAGPVRRVLGRRFGLIYTFLIFVLPITFSMAQEARMYTWAACFVTGSALFGFLAFKENKGKDWIFFGLLALFAAYTHYYALLASIVIFGLLCMMMLVKKKKMAPYLITLGAALLGYAPWLFKLTAQVSRVSKSFWIPPVTGEVIKSTLIYPFGNKFSYGWRPEYVDIAFYVAAALILFGLIYRSIKKDEGVKMAAFAVGGYALTILAGIVASYVIRPVLVARYMMPVFGLFTLGLAYGIGSLGKRILPIIGCLVILGLAVPQIRYNAQERFNGPMPEAVAYLETKLVPDDMFLHMDEHTFGTFCYYFPDYEQIYYQPHGTGGYSNYDAFQPQGRVVESLDAVGTGHRIWVVQRYGGANANLFREWQSEKVMIQDGSRKSFQVNPGWYTFEIIPVQMTE